MRRINALSDGPEGGAGLPYPFLGFGPNSNSFFATMLHAMGFDQPLFAQSARLVPGADRLFLVVRGPRDQACAELSRQAAIAPAP